MPWDSIAQEQRWTLLHGWIERTLIEQEAATQGLDRDPKIKAKLDEVHAELLRAKLMESRAIPVPAGTEVEAYYQSHAQEFQRAVDSYLIEVFWAENPEDISKLSLALTRGDSSLIESGEVQAEGRWLAGANELDNETVVELAGLRSGEFGQPRIAEEQYRIIRLIEFYPAGTQLSLSAVEDEIKMRIMIEKSRERDDALMNDLRSSYPVSIYMEDSE
jgi:hypothetical protein